VRSAARASASSRVELTFAAGQLRWWTNSKFMPCELFVACGVESMHRTGVDAGACIGNTSSQEALSSGKLTTGNIDLPSKRCIL
jgi:hypothetical protein